MGPKYSRYYTRIRPILNNKYAKTYSMVVFSIITSTIFGLFAIHPTLKTIIALQHELTEQQQTLQKLEQKITNLALGKKNYDALDAQMKNKLALLLPDATSLPCLIEDFNILSQNYQASISALQFQPTPLEGSSKCQPSDREVNKTAKAALLQEVSFTLNTQGSYPQLVAFLDALRTNNRAISIDDVTFNRNTENTLLLSINGKAFFFKK